MIGNWIWGQNATAKQASELEFWMSSIVANLELFYPLTRQERECQP
jgi:hypothetical protein